VFLYKRFALGYIIVFSLTSFANSSLSKLDNIEINPCFNEDDVTLEYLKQKLLE